jgi:hypothetical protein
VAALASGDGAAARAARATPLLALLPLDGGN